MRRSLPLRFAFPFGVLLLLPALALLAPEAHAQRGALGIGGQVGEPTGLSVRIGTGPALDFQAGWDISDDVVFAQGHILLANNRLPVTGADMRAFYGPGAFLAAHDDNTAFGLSLNAGLSVFFGALEVYGQITPRLQLIDETDFDLGGGLGARVYF